jgi:hypothetical protein
MHQKRFFLRILRVLRVLACGKPLAFGNAKGERVYVVKKFI